MQIRWGCGILESKSRIHFHRRKFGCAGACRRRAAQAGDIFVTDGSEAAWYTGPDKEGAQMHRILLAEDDDAIVRLLTDFLREEGFAEIGRASCRERV